MKEFRLQGWPDLPPPFHKIAHRRMVSDLSHRYVSLQHLVDQSRLRQQDVEAFLHMLRNQNLLHDRDALPLNGTHNAKPALGAWIKRTLTTPLSLW